MFRSNQAKQEDVKYWQTRVLNRLKTEKQRSKVEACQTLEQFCAMTLKVSKCERVHRAVSQLINTIETPVQTQLTVIHGGNEFFSRPSTAQLKAV